MPSSWANSTPTSWTTQSFLLQHTFLKWPIFLQPATSFHTPDTASVNDLTHNIYMANLEMLAALLVFCHFYFVKLLWFSNVTEYGHRHPFGPYQHILTSHLFIYIFVVNSLITSSNIVLSFKPWWIVVWAGSLFLYSCILLLCINSPSIPVHFCLHICIIFWTAGFDCLAILGSTLFS